MSVHSEQINEVAAALAKAQAVLGDAAKDSVNPHYDSRYADLASVWRACRKPLADNGLSVTQVPTQRDGEVILVTLLMHTSGQWIRSEYPIRPMKADPQGYGSALSYGRRYTLAALVGVCPADDDGEAAMSRVEAPRQKRREAGEGRAEVNRQFSRPAATPPPGPARPATPSAWNKLLDWALDTWNGFDPLPVPLVPSAAENDAKSREQVAREHRIVQELASAAVKDELLEEADLLKPAEAGKPPARSPAKVWANVKRLYAKERDWVHNALNLYLDDKEAEAGQPDSLEEALSS